MWPQRLELQAQAGDGSAAGTRKNVRRPVGQTEPCFVHGASFSGHCDHCSIDGIHAHTKALGPRSFPLVKRTR